MFKIFLTSILLTVIIFNQEVEMHHINKDDSKNNDKLENLSKEKLKEKNK